MTLGPPSFHDNLFIGDLYLLTRALRDGHLVGKMTLESYPHVAALLSTVNQSLSAVSIMLSLLTRGLAY